MPTSRQDDVQVDTTLAESEAASGNSIKPQDNDEEQSAQPLSKKAQKRAAKAALFAERKLERRAREKAAKKEKKRELAQKRAAGELAEDEEDAQRKKKRLKGEQNTEPFGARIVVDLGFDEMMTEKVCGQYFLGVSLLIVPLCCSGDRLLNFSAGIHLQCKPESNTPFHIRDIHFTQWSNAHAARRAERCRISTLGAYGMVGGGIRTLVGRQHRAGGRY
jgi:hypothetical protein